MKIYFNIIMINIYKGESNKNKGKKLIIHGKPGYVSAKLNFNSKSESDPSEGDDTDHLIKHPNFDGDMAYFDKTTVQFIQKHYFHINVFKFVLGCIPSFDAKISATKNKVDETPSNTRWNFSRIVPFKIKIGCH